MKLVGVVGYVVLEILAFAALVSWLGFGWAVLVVIAATAVGVLMLRRTADGVLRNLSDAVDGRKSAGPAVIETAVLAVSVILLAVPGIVSTALGLILLIKPLRMLLTPVFVYLGAKRVARFVEESNFVTVVAGVKPGYGTVVDGSVINEPRPDNSATGSGAADGSVWGGRGPKPGYRELPPV